MRFARCILVTISLRCLHVCELWFVREQLESTLKKAKLRLKTSMEVGLCGGKRKKDDATEYCMKRQLFLAERGLSSFVNGEQEIFDPDIKQPA